MITFIIPPSPFLADERVFMSLGILQVVAVVKNLGYDARVVDLSGIKNYLTVIEQVMVSLPVPSIFAITSTTPQFPAVCEITRKLRSVGHRVILGGPHPTMVLSAHKRKLARARRHAEAVLSSSDVVVAGDGQLTIDLAIRLAKEGHSQVIDADDPKSGFFMSHQQFNDSPWPSRESIDVSSYHYEILGKSSSSIVGQLGCPMACNFCSGRNTPTFRRIRLRSAANVISEIEHLVTTYGFEGVMFYDDELNINTAFVSMMQALIDLQDKLGKSLAFRGFVKAELFTDAQAQLMAKAGFKTLLSGFESGSPRILENINKKATQDDNTRCLDRARKYGIHMKALMSLGHPGESEDTVSQTQDWLLKVKPDEFDLTIITELPGSPYFDKSVEITPGVWTYTADNGDTLHSYDIDYSTTMDYYKGIPGEYISFVFTDALSPEKLVAARENMDAEVRSALNLPSVTSLPARSYDHSMGAIPPFILK